MGWYSNTIHAYPLFYSGSYTAYGFVKMSNLTTSFAQVRIFSSGGTNDQMDHQYVKRSSDNKTIYWYNSWSYDEGGPTKPYQVFNASSITYIFMGLY